MAKINGNEIRPGNVVEHDGSLWVAARHGHGIEHYHVAQVSTNDCGPHAVATAINFCLGAPVIDARALAREMNRPRLQAGFPPVVTVTAVSDVAEIGAFETIVSGCDVGTPVALLRKLGVRRSWSA